MTHKLPPRSKSARTLKKRSSTVTLFRPPRCCACRPTHPSIRVTRRRGEVDDDDGDRRTTHRRVLSRVFFNARGVMFRRAPGAFAAVEPRGASGNRRPGSPATAGTPVNGALRLGGPGASTTTPRGVDGVVTVTRPRARRGTADGGAWSGRGGGTATTRRDDATRRRRVRRVRCGGRRE